MLDYRHTVPRTPYRNSKNDTTTRLETMTMHRRRTDWVLLVSPCFRWYSEICQLLVIVCYRTLYIIGNTHKSEEPGSSGSIVSDYGLDDRAIEVRSPAGARDFSSILYVQTGSGAHPFSCTMGTGGPFSGGKSAAGAWRWPLTLI
jgi:hypothetical protein